MNLLDRFYNSRHVYLYAGLIGLGIGVVCGMVQDMFAAL